MLNLFNPIRFGKVKKQIGATAVKVVPQNQKTFQKVLCKFSDSDLWLFFIFIFCWLFYWTSLLNYLGGQLDELDAFAVVCRYYPAASRRDGDIVTLRICTVCMCVYVCNNFAALRRGSVLFKHSFYVPPRMEGASYNGPRRLSVCLSRASTWLENGKAYEAQNRQDGSTSQQ